jgi:hypothetical protein
MTPHIHCAIYTRKSSEEASSNLSTRLTRSAKRASLLSRASVTKAGTRSTPITMTAASRVGTWSGRH